MFSILCETVNIIYAKLKVFFAELARLIQIIVGTCLQRLQTYT